MKKQVAEILSQHRKTMPDREWLDYYHQVGYPSQTETSDEERIMSAVEFDAAESGLLPDEYYE